MNQMSSRTYIPPTSTSPRGTQQYVPTTQARTPRGRSPSPGRQATPISYGQSASPQQTYRQPTQPAYGQQSYRSPTAPQQLSPPVNSLIDAQLGNRIFPGLNSSTAKQQIAQDTYDKILGGTLVHVEGNLWAVNTAKTGGLQRVDAGGYRRGRSQSPGRSGSRGRSNSPPRSPGGSRRQSTALGNAHTGRSQSPGGR